MKATIRECNPRDLGKVLQLWERVGAGPQADGALALDQAVDLINDDGAAALVAEIEGEIVGAVIGDARGGFGWVHALMILPGTAVETGVADDLLAGIEMRLAEQGARVLGAVARGDGVRDHLEQRDYRAQDGTAYLEREVSPVASVPTSLAQAWGRMIDPGLWERLHGLDAAKQIIERRVILPLAETELATRHAVTPPKAIVLFGPPGTGKTTFAQGIASRLRWPFVEIQPSELGGEGPEQEARLLAETFDRIRELPAAVTFVDEVEDLASMRHESRRVSPSVTNEFLKQIPRLRENEQQLLVCATNWIGRLDPAFVRPGRFDYLLPVGPPDDEARAAIWRRYVEEIADEPVDIEALVEASEMFTPADIEFAARKAAHRAFEREYFEQAAMRASTEDFLEAIGQTHSTLSAEMIADFEEEAAKFARF